MDTRLLHAAFVACLLKLDIIFCEVTLIAESRERLGKFCH